MKTLSAIILTKNEEHNLERCLKSLSFCNEIIIVDDLSEDNTISIAQKFNAKIIQNNLNGDFARQRNIGMEQASSDWLLFIDADEEVTQELQKEIIKEINSSSTVENYFIKRSDWFWGKELQYGEVAKARNIGFIRLVQKGSGTWKGTVHEEYKSTKETATLENILYHYPHPTIKDFLNSVNFYSTLRAKELFDQKKKTNTFELIAFPFGKFIYTYFFKLGFLDGPAGFAYAFFMSFHSFLVRAKLFQYSEIDK